MQIYLLKTFKDLKTFSQICRFPFLQAKHARKEFKISKDFLPIFTENSKDFSKAQKISSQNLR